MSSARDRRASRPARAIDPDPDAAQARRSRGRGEGGAARGGARRYPGLVLKKKTVDINDAPETPAKLTLEFEAGIPTRVVNAADGVDIDGKAKPLDLFLYLNKVRSVYGRLRLSPSSPAAGVSLFPSSSCLCRVSPVLRRIANHVAMM